MSSRIATFGLFGPMNSVAFALLDTFTAMRCGRPGGMLNRGVFRHSASDHDSPHSQRDRLRLKPRVHWLFPPDVVETKVHDCPGDYRTLVVLHFRLSQFGVEDELLEP